MVNTSSHVARYADRTPDAPALIGSGRRLTYAQLQSRVSAIAAGLRERGVAAGDIVGVLSENRTEYVETVLAINRLGAIFLLLNFRLAPPEWQYILGHAGAGLVIAQPDLAQRLETVEPGRDMLRFGDEFDALADAHAGAHVDDAVVTLADTQRLMYTSGTTSRPKGVRLSYGNVIFKATALSAEFDITAADRCLICGPLYHVGGMDLPGTGVFTHGAAVIVLERFDPVRVLQTIASEKPTCVWLAPAMVSALVQCPALGEHDLTSVRFSIHGGEKMPVPTMHALLQAFPASRVADAYGLTETVGGDTCMDRAHVLEKLGSVGRPVLYVDCKVVADDGADAAPDEVGEICLRGPKVFDGYWRNPQATAEAIDSDGWFHTGDVGRLDADGYLYIVDRKGDMIISGGENIASSEVERVIDEHAAVLEVAVVAMPSERWGEVPKAFVVVGEGETLSVEALVAHCRERLAGYKVPKAVAFIDALPRNPSGKVLKRLLRERDDG